MIKKNKNLFKQAQDYIMIVLGLLSYTFGFTAFILPEKVVTGGVTGLAALLHFGMGWNTAITYFVINAILLSIAFRTVGRQFVIRTVIGASLATVFLGVMEPFFPTPIVEQQSFMNIIIGAIMCGLGIGTVFVHNGSTAGTDIVAAMVTKHTNISFGRMMLYMDLMIIASSYIIFHSIDTIVYGVVFMIINSFVTDMVINSNRQAVQFMIFSEKWEEIANAINNEAHRGCTLLNGTGWYTKREVKILLVMCRKFESVHIFRIIKAVDEHALIAQSNMNGVYGLGFDKMKIKMHNYKPQTANETTSYTNTTHEEQQK